jgi:hypothetical protein
MQTGLTEETPVTQPDLDRIRFVTRHFNGLKGGLILVALGLSFLSTGAGYNGWGHYAVVFYLRIALIFGYLALMLYAKTYYQKRFGEVLEQREELPHQEALSIYGSGAGRRPVYADTGPGLLMVGRVLLIGGLGVIVFVGVRMVSPTAGMPSMPDELPIFGSFATVQQLMDIVLGALFLSTWISRGRSLSQGYYLALALLMLGIPALGASQGFLLPALQDHGLIRMVRFALPAADDMYMGMLLCGASCLLAGLLDHRQLARAFKPAVG